MCFYDKKKVNVKGNRLILRIGVICANTNTRNGSMFEFHGRRQIVRRHICCTRTRPSWLVVVPPLMRVALKLMHRNRNACADAVSTNRAVDRGDVRELRGNDEFDMGMSHSRDTRGARHPIYLMLREKLTLYPRTYNVILVASRRGRDLLFPKWT